MNLIWLPDARDDIERLFGFLLEVNPPAADRVVRLIQSCARRLADHPEIGRPMDDDGERRELYMSFGASAYVLRYRIEGQTIVIIRVWHGRENRV